MTTLNGHPPFPFRRVAIFAVGYTVLLLGIILFALLPLAGQLTVPLVMAATSSLLPAAVIVGTLFAFNFHGDNSPPT